MPGRRGDVDARVAGLPRARARRTARSSTPLIGQIIEPEPPRIGPAGSVPAAGGLSVGLDLAPASSSCCDSLPSSWWRSRAHAHQRVLLAGTRAVVADARVDQVLLDGRDLVAARGDPRGDAPPGGARACPAAIAFARRLGLGVAHEPDDALVLLVDAAQELAALEQLGEALGAEDDGDEVGLVGLVALDQALAERMRRACARRALAGAPGARAGSAARPGCGRARPARGRGRPGRRPGGPAACRSGPAGGRSARSSARCRTVSTRSVPLRRPILPCVTSILRSISSSFCSFGRRAARARSEGPPTRRSVRAQSGRSSRGRTRRPRLWASAVTVQRLQPGLRGELTGSRRAAALPARQCARFAPEGAPRPQWVPRFPGFPGNSAAERVPAPAPLMRRFSSFDKIHRAWHAPPPRVGRDAGPPGPDAAHDVPARRCVYVVLRRRAVRRRRGRRSRSRSSPAASCCCSSSPPTSSRCARWARARSRRRRRPSCTR